MIFEAYEMLKSYMHIQCYVFLSLYSHDFSWYMVLCVKNMSNMRDRCRQAGMYTDRAIQTPATIHFLGWVTRILAHSYRSGEKREHA